MWLCIFTCKHFEDTYENTHWRQVTVFIASAQEDHLNQHHKRHAILTLKIHQILIVKLNIQVFQRGLLLNWPEIKHCGFLHGQAQQNLLPGLLKPFNRSVWVHSESRTAKYVKSRESRHLGNGTSDHRNENPKTLFNISYPPKPGENHLRNHCRPLEGGFSAIATYKT